MGRFGTAHHFDFDYFANLFNELSLRLGKEIYAETGTLRGSFFNDRILAGEGVETVSAGFGNDMILTNGTAGTVYDGGRGTDTYILGANGQSSFIEDCLIFDLGSGSARSNQDQIVLTQFSADSRVIDLGNGVVEVVDTDGDVAIIEVQNRDGRPVEAEAIIDSLVFAGEGLTKLDAPGQSPLMIANNLDREAARDFKADAKSFRSDTIIIDESVAGKLNTGGGDDVVIADLSDASRGDVFVFNTGRGNDILEINMGTGIADTVIRDSGVGGNDVLNFIFDDNAASPPRKCFVNLDDDIAGSTRLSIDGFGDLVEVFDRDDGAVMFRDVGSGALFGCYFCDVDGLAVDAADLNESDKFFTDFTWIDPIG